MRIHYPLAAEAVELLRLIIIDNQYADRAMERAFKANRRLGARDRRFIAEGVYDVIRYRRLLAHASGLASGAEIKPIDLWKVFGAWLVKRNWELPPFAEFKTLQADLVRERLRGAKHNPAIAESIPDWLYERGVEELGAETWNQMLHALNQPAPVVLRTNRLRTTPADLALRLNTAEIKTDPAKECADGLVLRERQNIFVTDAFKEGWFEVQDGASQQIAPLTGAKPGLRIIDACAGAGGKTLHLAALMQNKGKIIALDINSGRLDELKKRSRRGGCDIIEIRLIDSSKVLKRLESSADAVLLDVPCSGLGVLRRNPDTKWKLTADELTDLNQLQTQILNEYCLLVKKGGRLVYATCSVLPSENERQIASFMQTHSDAWKLIEERRFFPGHNGYDGFYAAVLERLL